jgi:hypothetical protein
MGIIDKAARGVEKALKQPPKAVGLDIDKMAENNVRIRNAEDNDSCAGEECDKGKSND